MKPELLKSIERLEPASFTIIMATGAYAITTLDMSALIPWLIYPAHFINIINFIIFSLLIIFALCTWPFHNREFMEDLNFPQSTAFYSAIGISFLVLGTEGIRFEMGFWFSFILWAIGCALTLGINFAINFRFFIYATPELKLFTPVFFIPIGGLVVIPVGGVTLMENMIGISYDVMLLINLLSLGGGLLLYLGMFSLLMQRHYLMEYLPHNLVPTIWIHLAPIGWGGVSFFNLAESLGDLKGLGQMMAGLLWGGCCWWLIMCMLLTCRELHSRQMKFSLAFWAFIFPLGSITVLSFKLGEAFSIAFYFTWALMSFIWLIAAFNTLKSFLNYILHLCSSK